jgi:hypothetical protein
MKKALKDYAQGDDEKSKAPVQEKSVLFKLLDDAFMSLRILPRHFMKHVNLKYSNSNHALL